MVCNTFDEEGFWCFPQSGATWSSASVLLRSELTKLTHSHEFYERLGWRRSMAKNEDIVFFQVGGMALALFPRKELAKDANVPGTGSGFSGMTLALQHPQQGRGGSYPG